MSTANLQNALWLGSKGLHIFPLYPVRGDSKKTACACNDGEKCQRIGRHPIHDDFASVATCDEGAIRQLWEPCPDAEIALLTGQKSGIIALEIRPSEDNPDPLRGYAVPPAPAIACAGKTVRLYSAPDEPIKGRVELGNGLALRGEKSFVVLPDAIAANGEKYDWAPGQTLQTTRISPLPSYFVNPPNEYDESNGAPLDEYAQDFAERYRHDTEPRASFDPAKPEIIATLSGMDYQRNESQPAANATPRRIRTVSIVELIETPDPEDTSICPALGIWHGERPMGIIGYSGTAKSWIMLWLAIQFATGRPLFDNPAWQIKRRYRVLILDYELNRRIHKKRQGELCTTMGLDYRAIGDGLHYGEHPDLYLNDENAEKILEDETAGFDVIAIDALRPAVPGEDENDSKFRRFVDLLTRVAVRTGRYFIILHHTGHVGKNQSAEPRGSSGIRDALGAIFTVTNGDDKRAPKRLENTKMAPNADDFAEPIFVQLKRDGEDEKGPMRITFMTEEQAEEQAEEKMEQFAEGEFVERMRRILNVIRKKPGISRNGIGEIVKGNKPKRDKIIDWLLEKGHIENKGTEKRHKYELTSVGQEWLDKGSRYAPRTPGPNASTTPNSPPSSPDNAPEASDTSTDTPEPAKDA